MKNSKLHTIKQYKNFFFGKTVIVTGHTGFKGSWLSYVLWLFGAKVIGISSYELGHNSNYKVLNINSKLYKEFKIDIYNLDKLRSIFIKSKPDIIYHLAAQSLVSKSIKEPIETFKTNIIGTTNILESLRYIKKKCSAVIVTSDKCYYNREINKGYVESDILGGDDPYSSSKAATEIIFKSYYKSYFSEKKNISLATARAGNVIGGGDFSVNRIVPDVIRSISKKTPLNIRNPKSTRPWQHVLEPLRGYIDLSINLHKNNTNSGESFNFGPRKSENYSVIDVVNIIREIVQSLKIKINKKKPLFKESGLLKLNCKKSYKLLGWKPFINTKESISLTINWYLIFLKKKDIEDYTFKQISNYFE